jgi:hypothetical protein
MSVGKERPTALRVFFTEQNRGRKQRLGMTLEKIAVNAFRKYRTSRSMVADGLREAILSGALQEGQSLHQEEIAILFGVSRVPVRIALSQFKGEGFMTSCAHRGAWSRRSRTTRSGR